MVVKGGGGRRRLKRDRNIDKLNRERERERERERGGKRRKAEGEGSYLNVKQEEVELGWGQEAGGCVMDVLVGW